MVNLLQLSEHIQCQPLSAFPSLQQRHPASRSQRKPKHNLSLLYPPISSPCSNHNSALSRLNTQVSSTILLNVHLEKWYDLPTLSCSLRWPPFHLKLNFVRRMFRTHSTHFQICFQFLMSLDIDIGILLHQHKCTAEMIFITLSCLSRKTFVLRMNLGNQWKFQPFMAIHGRVSNWGVTQFINSINIYSLLQKK